MADKYGKKIKMADLDSFLGLLQDKLSDFDVSAIRNEGHLRELIMNKALDAAVNSFTVSKDGGEPVLLAELPEGAQEWHLEKLLPKLMGDVKGPGALLRHKIALMILDYRMLLRLKETLPALHPASPKHRRVIDGISHVESRLRSGMLFLEAWPRFEPDFGEEREIDQQAVMRDMLKFAFMEPTDE